MKKDTTSSLKSLFEDTQFDTYTKQTIISLFRCMVETIVETKSDAVVLLKLCEKRNFEGLITRLDFSAAKIYDYSDLITNKSMKNDEFLIIFSDRFSVCLFWNKLDNEEFEVYHGISSLDPYLARKVYDSLQSIIFNEKLDSEFLKIKQDRRQNVKFTSILNKLVGYMEGQQRDLICFDTELKELKEKLNKNEKLANIGYVCSNVAHEIRNPLSLLNIYTKIINTKLNELDCNDEKNKINIQSIESSINNISKAVNNLDTLLCELLDYSKPLVLDIKENNLSKVISEAVEFLLPAYEEKNVKLLLNIDLKGFDFINFDKNRIYQVLINLLKNALEASHEESEVKIDTNYSDADDMIYIKVKNQGQKIEPELIDKLFQPYFSTKTKGTGLGLARSKEIIDLHKGNLSLLSSDEVETVFIIKLPLIIS